MPPSLLLSPRQPPITLQPTFLTSWQEVEEGRGGRNRKRPSEVSEPSATCVHASLSKSGKKERTGKRGRSHRDGTEVEASMGMRAALSPLLFRDTSDICLLGRQITSIQHQQEVAGLMIQLFGLRSSPTGQSEPQAAAVRLSEAIIDTRCHRRDFSRQRGSLFSRLLPRDNSQQEIGPGWWINDLFIDVRLHQPG